MQARRLADGLRAAGRWRSCWPPTRSWTNGGCAACCRAPSWPVVRAQALVAAAVRADVVERQIRPALDAGALVVMERFVDSPLAHFSATGSPGHRELEGLVDWATGRLRPDLTMLLDRDPARCRRPRQSTSSTTGGCSAC